VLHDINHAIQSHMMKKTEKQSMPPFAEPGLSGEEMKAFVRRHFDDFVNRKLSTVALQNFSHDFLDHDGPAGPVVGPAAAKQMMEGAYRKWPDLRVEVLDAISEGDRVVVRNQWTATDSVSGKKVEFHGFVMWRFANGKIVERWATLTDPEEIP
jgi:predicted ester cyclase